VDRNAGPACDDRRDVVLVDLLLDHRLGLLLVALRELLLERGQLAVADLGDALEVPLALGAFRLHAQRVDALRDLADPVERLLLARPARREAVATLLRLGELRLDRRAYLVLLPRHRGELDLELR